MLISVLTITYQRHHLLEEAINSFLLQDYTDTEMLIINDSTSVKYYCDHKKIRIINCDLRFPSLLEKLEFGFQQSKGDFVYRLDDDDLLAPNGLQLVENYIQSNPNFDIYRCQNHYNFTNNIYQGLGDNINNGNCYSQQYLKKFNFESCSFGEDVKLTFNPTAKIYVGEPGQCSMVYRWGMDTYHVSGWGDQLPEKTNINVDEFISKNLNVEVGDIFLNPHFKQDYYSMIV
jgi:glycosyltransferase involved in cell wall biosynthesis